MFKKISSILLSLVLLVSLSGVSIHKQYCQGELLTTGIFSIPKTCGCEEDAKTGLNERCCNIESSYIKICAENYESESECPSYNLEKGILKNSNLIIADNRIQNTIYFKIKIPPTFENIPVQFGALRI